MSKFDAVGEGYLLTDLRSKNSTFVNGYPVVSHWLAHGETIQICKHTLSFGLTGNELKKQPSPFCQMDQTMILDTNAYRNLMSEHVKETPDAQPQKSQETAGFLSFLTGGSGEFELSKKLIRIGKS